MKIAYLSGPANGPGIHEEWTRGSQEYFGTDYMKQFLQLSDDLGAESWVITWSGQERERVQKGKFTFDNRPLTRATGLRYYLDLIWWHVRLWPRLLAFRPDVLVLTGNLYFWWTLSWVGLLGTRLVPSFHGTLWPKLKPVRRTTKLLLALERILVFRQFKVVVATSHDISRQVAEITDAPVIHHLPSYSQRQFAGIAPPPEGTPFRVLFMGRMEVSKGVFDVLEMARQLPHCHFDACGVGNDLARAQAAAPANVTFHGFCNQTQLQALFSQAHASVVPTRSDFEAGFEMTCAEAILAGRPLVTSAACPALEYLRPATVEVEVDNIDQYVAALDKLSSDPAFYRSKQAATKELQAQFYDPAHGWLAAMKAAFARIGIKPGSR